MGVRDQARQGIGPADRHEGFGRDVWVESLEVAEGEHGAELLVEFGVALPSRLDWQGVPLHGSLKHPFDAEWRELSGYADPARYAPVVVSPDQWERVLVDHAWGNVDMYFSELLRGMPRPFGPSEVLESRLILGQDSSVHPS